MSSRLIKAAIVLLPFYFAQIICGQDGDWEKVGSSEDAVVLFSIKRTTQTNGLMRTWVKRELKDRTRERSIEWAKNRGESPTQYQNYAYTLSLEEFNCKKKQLRVLSTLDYDIKGPF